MTIVITGMRTSRGQNAREHHMARSRRVKEERERVAWVLCARKAERPALPCVVTLTRVAPSNGLDDDNLSGAMKAVRDQVAHWIGVDDARRDIVRYEYEQRRGPWAVEISWRAM